MNPTNDLDFTKILHGFYRHKALICVTTIIVFALSFYLSTVLPNVYRSSTLILITPQRVPTSFVAPTVTTTVLERINSITQDILSRTRLENVIKEFNLYPHAATMEDRVVTFRRNIHLDARRTDAFQVSFESESPDTAMKVANRLGSLFIEENLQVREQQAVGTTTFIDSEADRLRKELDEQESEVTRYKVAHRFELPDQLDANLRTVEQLRSELKDNMATMQSMQDRRASLEKQLLEADKPPPIVSKDGETVISKDLPPAQQIKIRKEQIDALRLRYSDKYPDIIRLQGEIKAYEKQQEREKAKPLDKKANATATDNPLSQLLQEQLDSLKSSISSVRAANEELRKQIGELQQRVDNTPLRAIELSKISRTYNITLRKYQDLLAKGLDSEISENLEKKQKGEQFQVVDPANFPLTPIRPNRPLLLVGGLVAGLLGGLALAFIWETLDRSFKNSDDLLAFTNLPVLVTIPAVPTRGAILERRRVQSMLGASALASLTLGLILIRLFGARLF